MQLLNFNFQTMSNDELTRQMVIKRLGQLCNYHDELCQEKAVIEAKILETVEVLKQAYVPKHRPSASLRSASADKPA